MKGVRVSELGVTTEDDGTAPSGVDDGAAPSGTDIGGTWRSVGTPPAGAVTGGEPARDPGGWTAASWPPVSMATVVPHGARVPTTERTSPVVIPVMAKPRSPYCLVSRSASSLPVSFAERTTTMRQHVSGSSGPTCSTVVVAKASLAVARSWAQR